MTTLTTALIIYFLEIISIILKTNSARRHKQTQKGDMRPPQVGVSAKRLFFCCLFDQLAFKKHRRKYSLKVALLCS